MDKEFSFGKLLRELRVGEKLSQTELAALLSTSQDAVSLWELDKSLPSFSSIKQLSVVFKISADILLGLKDY
jgi:transcriptional regulator with XRE-family HTH domain